jgi:MFS family permease
MDQSKVYARRWWALAVLCLTLLIIGLDNTILNVAIPSLVNDLDASNSQLQWIIDSYTLVFAGLLLTTGSLGDRFGRRRALAVGLVMFGIGSVASAMVTTATALIFTRAFMGAATNTATGELWFCGGRAPFSAECQAYNPSTQSWSVKPSLPSARSELAMAFDPNSGNLYAFGGRASCSAALSCTVAAIVPCFLRYFLSARIQVTRSLTSPAGTCGLGGIGIWPHAPTPPSLTFFSSAACAFLSPLYLAATSTYAGPTIFLSIEWHAAQPSFFIIASALALSSAA